jgi:hypothetical protein
MAMGRTALQEVHGVVLKNDLAFNLSITGRTDGDRHVIEEVRTNAISHAAPL